MSVFSNRMNYSEVVIPKKNNNEPPEEESIPISALPDGEYKALQYGYTFELEDGSKYKTTYGVRQSRRIAFNNGGFKTYDVKDGMPKLKQKKFSGFGECHELFNGPYDYGERPVPGENITRSTVDTAGFRIPDEVIKKNHVNMPVRKFKMGDKTYAEISTQSPNYIGGPRMNQVSLSRDPSVVKRDKRGNLLNSSSSGTLPRPAPAGGELEMKWGSDKPFHLGIEPWITAPILSDNTEGLYLGTVQGEQFTTRSGEVILMGIKLGIDYPEQVLGVVKGKKLYIFKQSQLVSQSGSKIFSEVISTDEEFRSYAHNLMKNAHKDNYSAATTDKVVDDLLKDHQGSDYGELIGRLKSNMGNKGFADVIPVGNITQMGVNYKFDPIPQNIEADPVKTAWYTLPNLIGTLVMSTSYAHLYHLCTRDYAMHMALEGYYNRMPYEVDKLAETYLSDNKEVEFRNAIVPADCPVEYITKLLKFTENVVEVVPSAKAYQPQIDSIIELLKVTLYKMKRLTAGKKMFSLAEDRQFAISVETSGKVGLGEAVETVTNSIMNYFNKFKKSPVKEIKTDDGKVVKEYVTRSMMNDKSRINLINSLAKALDDTIKLSIK